MPVLAARTGARTARCLLAGMKEVASYMKCRGVFMLSEGMRDTGGEAAQER